MTNTLKFALVALLFFVVGCNQSYEYYEEESEVNTPKPSLFEVVEFTPAPGQFINEGYTVSSMDEACTYAQQQLDRGYDLSLGGFGGYIIVKFKAPIVNSGNYDFVIYGNSFVGGSEPGVVWVSCDSNKNGVADDEWFELYGSESGKATTKSNYSITYSRTEDAAIISWLDSEGESGVIERNTAHKQDYFPAWIESNSYTLYGTLLPDNSVWSESSSRWILNAFEWGYADNYSAIDCTADKANCFRVSDAHNSLGEPVNLHSVDFVKVQSAINCINASIGEASTEVKGFALCGN